MSSSAITPPRLVKCPTCNNTVAWTKEQQFRPFCSVRCKLIDLGEWVTEEKKIAGESVLLNRHNIDANIDADFWQ